MDAKLAKTYYSRGGYWKGLAAIKKLAEAAKVPEDAAKKGPYRQALWQIYFPAPLPEVVAALKKKTAQAIKENSVFAKPQRHIKDLCERAKKNSPLSSVSAIFTNMVKDLFPRAAAHFSSEIQCADAQQGAPS